MSSSMVKLFEDIRDVPLHNPEYWEDQDRRCLGKHRKLKGLFEKKCFKTRYCVCSFKWSDQRILREILAIKHDGEDNHLFLEFLS